VEVSSCILLRLSQSSKKQTIKIRSFPSMLVFIDKFVNLSPQMNQNSLEEVLPYVLVRSMYTSLYHVKGGKGKKAKKAGGVGTEEGEL